MERHYLVYQRRLADYKELFNEFKKSDMTIWVSTPSFAECVCKENNFNNDMLPKLESMIFIGEVLPKSYLKNF